MTILLPGAVHPFSKPPSLWRGLIKCVPSRASKQVIHGDALFYQLTIFRGEQQAISHFRPPLMYDLSNIHKCFPCPFLLLWTQGIYKYSSPSITPVFKILSSCLMHDKWSHLEHGSQSGIRRQKHLLEGLGICRCRPRWCCCDWT